MPCSSRMPGRASCGRSSTAPRSPPCGPGRPRRVSAQLLGAADAKSVGIIGCGVNGAWAARCLAAAGYGPGVCADVRTDVADALAAELGWRVGRSRRGGDPGRGGHGDARHRAGCPRLRPAARASTSRPWAPTPGARRRSSTRHSSAAGSSATSGRRPRPAGELSGAVAAGRVDRDGVTRDRRRHRSAGRRAGARTRRSRSSTRPAWRSRTWRSQSPCTRHGVRVGSTRAWRGSRPVATR